MVWYGTYGTGSSTESVERDKGHSRGLCDGASHLLRHGEDWFQRLFGGTYTSVLSPLRVTHRYAGVIRMTGDVMSHNRVEHHICTHTQNCPVYVSLIQGLQLHYHTANYYQRHTQLLVWTTTEAIVPLVSHLSSCSVELRPHQ